MQEHEEEIDGCEVNYFTEAEVHEAAVDLKMIASGHDGENNIKSIVRHVAITDMVTAKLMHDELTYWIDNAENNKSRI